MSPAPPRDEAPENDAPGTLGALLYADKSRERIAESEWAALVAAMASGDQSALRALYERTHRLVFTLALRLSGSRETAEELTVDTYQSLWQRAAGYDPANGTVVGWIMNQARSRAIDRLRFEQRQKRTAPDGPDASEPISAEDTAGTTVQSAGEASLLHEALRTLTGDERSAIETAYFGDMSYSAAATQLGVPLGTVKTRIRSALRKLRQVLNRSEAP